MEYTVYSISPITVEQLTMQAEFKTVEPYVINFLKANFWKVEGFMDYEDALSEAKLQFIRTVKRLHKRNCVIENEKHLMALFKTSWNNHYTTLSNKATHERFVQTQNSTDDDQNLMDTLVGDLDNSGVLLYQLQNAPSEVKQVLRILMNSPTEVIEVMQEMFRTNHLAGNSMLCRMLGKNPTEHNLIKKTLDFLGVGEYT